MFRGVQENIAPARTPDCEQAVKGGPFGQTRTGLLPSVINEPLYQVAIHTSAAILISGLRLDEAPAETDEPPAWYKWVFRYEKLGGTHHGAITAQCTTSLQSMHV
jgi:hypothetical protein